MIKSIVFSLIFVLLPGCLLFNGVLIRQCDDDIAAPGEEDFCFGAKIFEVGTTPVFAEAGDINSNGNFDLIIANSVSDDISVLLGNGDGTFQPQVVFQVGNSPSSLGLEDLDNDGNFDLFIVNEISDDITILFGKGDGTF